MTLCVYTGRDVANRSCGTLVVQCTGSQHAAQPKVLDRSSQQGCVLLCSGRVYLKAPTVTVEACALKTVPYTSVIERQKAHAELYALYTARGTPHMVQGLAAATYQSLNKTCLYIATR